MDVTKLREPLLKVFIWFLVITALIAIIAVLAGEFGEFIVKVVVTSTSISAASLCGMSCAAFVERRGRHELGITGVALAWAAAAMIICGIWFEWGDDDYWKAIGVLSVSAGAIAHICLLGLPQLDARHRWAQPFATVSITILAIQLNFTIIFELFDDDLVLYFRLLAVVAILTGLVTLTIPILVKLRKNAQSAAQRLVLEHLDGDRYKADNGTIYHVTAVSPPPNT